MDTAAQESEDREQRNLAAIEHIFKREGIYTPQAAIKHLAVFQAHASLLCLQFLTVITLCTNPVGGWTGERKERDVKLRMRSE